jgi:branched-chain amino acid transport system ATP-binding protein
VRTTNALEVTGLKVQYGPVTAVADVSFTAPEGAMVAVLGANGAGKTSTIRAVSGLEPARAGQIRLFGEDVTRLKPHQRVLRGLVQVPERRRIFSALTVRENLELGAYLHYKNRPRTAEDLERVLTLFPRLKERLGQIAGMLSGGEQQMLAMGRALMTRPRVLMLDEPSLGLAPQMIRLIYDTLARIRETGTTVLLVEQNARLAVQTASHVYVLRAGRVVLDGPAATLKDEATLARAYLGADQ